MTQIPQNPSIKKDETNSADFKFVIGLEKESDRDARYELLYRTWLDTYPNTEIGITREDVEEMYKDRLTPEKKAQLLENLKNRIADPNIHSFCAKDGDVVIGTVTLIQSLEFDKLQTIYVLPEYQGKKIGYGMWTEISKFFTKGKPVKVEVAEYNTKVIAFYERLGFKDTGKRFSDPKFTMPISKVVIPQMELEFIPE
jgi:GNAT superfamily N-acetyltransferase